VRFSPFPFGGGVRVAVGELFVNEWEERKREREKERKREREKERKRKREKNSE
jgi:hypothetical protein